MKIENEVQIMLEKDIHFFGVMFMVGLSEFQNQELKDFILGNKNWNSFDLYEPHLKPHPKIAGVSAPRSNKFVYCGISFSKTNIALCLKSYFEYKKN